MFEHTIFEINLSVRYDYIVQSNQANQKDIEREFSKPSRPTDFFGRIRSLF